MSGRRIVVGVGAVVVAQLAVGRGLHRLYAAVPEYHAFWSGTVFWASGLAFLATPTVVAAVVARGRTRHPVMAGAIITVGSLATLIVAGAIAPLPERAYCIALTGWTAAVLIAVRLATHRRQPRAF